MPYYHVTYDRHIASILRHGLGGKTIERNWPLADEGVYLSDDPCWGLVILIQRALNHTPDDISPKAFVESLRVIVIDDTRIDRSRLGEDPSFPGWDHIRLYNGVIDVTAMPILHVDDVIPQDVHAAS